MSQRKSCYCVTSEIFVTNGTKLQMKPPQDPRHGLRWMRIKINTPTPTRRERRFYFCSSCYFLHVKVPINKTMLQAPSGFLLQICPFNGL